MTTKSKQKSINKKINTSFTKFKKKYPLLKSLKLQHLVLIIALFITTIGLISAMVVSQIGQDIRQQASVNVPYRAGDPCNPTAIDRSEEYCSPNGTKISCNTSGRWEKVGTCDVTDKDVDKIAQKDDPGGDEAGGIGENEICNTTEQCASGLACIDTPYGRYCLDEDTAGCGNGRCEREFGETNLSCPRDCSHSDNEPNSKNLYEYCSITTDCTGDLVCLQNKCENLQPIGGYCESTAHCQDGLACSNFVCKELQNFDAEDGEPIYSACKKSFEFKETRYEDERRRCMSGAPRVIWSDAVCGCISTDTSEGESAARIISSNQEELGYTEENGYGGFDASSTYSDFNRVGYCATQVRGNCEVSRTNRNDCQGVFNLFDEYSALTSCQTEVNLEIVSCVYYGSSLSDQNSQCNTLVDVPRAECDRVGGTIYTGSREEAVANCASNNNLEWCVLKTGNNCFSRQYDIETCNGQNGVRYGNQRPSYEDEQTLCRTIVVEEDQENRSGVCVERQNGVCTARDYIDVPESECVSDSITTRQFFPMNASMVQGSLGSVRTSVCEYYGLESTTVEEDLELGYCSTYNSELGRCTNYQSSQITTNAACNEAGGYFAPQSSNANPNDAIAACNSSNNIGDTCYYIENYGEPNCVSDTRSLSECNSLNGFSAINRPHPFDDCTQHIRTINLIEKNDLADIDNPLGYCASATTACVPVLVPYETCTQNNGFWPSDRLASGLSTRDDVSRSIVQERCDNSLNYREVQAPTVAVSVTSDTSTSAPFSCRIPILGSFLCNQSNSATGTVQSRNTTGIQAIDTFFNVFDALFGTGNEASSTSVTMNYNVGWCVTGIGTEECAVTENNTETGCAVDQVRTLYHFDRTAAYRECPNLEVPESETVEETTEVSGPGWCVYMAANNNCTHVYEGDFGNPRERCLSYGSNSYAEFYENTENQPVQPFPDYVVEDDCGISADGENSDAYIGINDTQTIGQGQSCFTYQNLDNSPHCVTVSGSSLSGAIDGVYWCALDTNPREFRICGNSNNCAKGQIYETGDNGDFFCANQQQDN